MIETDIEANQKSLKGTFEKSQHGARIAAVQAIFAMQHSNASLASSIEAYAKKEIGLDQNGNPIEYSNPELFAKIIEGVIDNQSKIDNAIQGGLKPGWRLDRLDGVSLSILRAATAELLINLELSNSVIVSEYVTMANEYFDDPEPKFIHGCLDTLAVLLRP